MQITWTNLAMSDLNNVENKLSQAHDTHIAEDDVFRIINAVETLPDLASDTRQVGDVCGTFEYRVESVQCSVVYQIDNVVSQIQVLRIMSNPDR